MTLTADCVFLMLIIFVFIASYLKLDSIFYNAVERCVGYRNTVKVTYAPGLC